MHTNSRVTSLDEHRHLLLNVGGLLLWKKISQSLSWSPQSLNATIGLRKCHQFLVKPKWITVFRATGEVKICASQDLTKHLVNRAKHAVKLTRHPKSALGMRALEFALSCCLTHLCKKRARHTHTRFCTDALTGVHKSLKKHTQWKRS